MERDRDEILDVNVRGLFFTLQSVARHMIERGSGSIINIASVAGRVGRRGQQGRYDLDHQVSSLGTGQTASAG